MHDFRPQFVPISIGSLPHIDPHEAFNLILKLFPELPAWPQLPKRSFLENMYAQFSEGFPGVILERERIFVDRGRDLSSDLERLYLAYLENDLDACAVSPGYAAGLYEMSKAGVNAPRAVKGQVTGPISWGLSVVDQEGRPVLYDDVLADAVAKHLRLKAVWQENELRRLHPVTVVILDEPYMASFGSAYVALTRERVVSLIDEVLDGLEGLKGVHCCGNTDWSLMLSASIDVLSFDAFHYAHSLALYPAEVDEFLRRGGIIAWGIVPYDGENLARETVRSLVDRLHRTMHMLVEKGVDFDRLLAASMVSPCCGLGSARVEHAERSLALTVGVSQEMRKRYLRS
jgi:methionine synthase II (cobalamin-independent)